MNRRSLLAGRCWPWAWQAWPVRGGRQDWGGGGPKGGLFGLPISWEEITYYNNFYEFGTDKCDPVKNPGSHDNCTMGRQDRRAGATAPVITRSKNIIGSVLSKNVSTVSLASRRGDGEPSLERLRAADLLRDGRVSRSGGANTWPLNPCSGQREMRASDFPGSGMGPYVKGLRLDEAMHPLTIMATGKSMGRESPNQNGRAAAGWSCHGKYGFKSIKVRVADDPGADYATADKLGTKAAAA